MAGQQRATGRATVNVTAKTLLLGGALLAQAGGLAAQACRDQEPVGWIGIANVACTTCLLSYPGDGRPSLFSTEPRIATIAAGSPAAGILRPGDVLVSVDDQLITTHAGGLRLANLKPGETVTLGIRRNGELQSHRFANLPSICPYDTRILGSRARPGVYTGVAAGQFRAQPLDTVMVRAGSASAPRSAAASSLPRIGFGFSFSCETCARYSSTQGAVWQFREPPEIYNVEENSQAHRAGIRRGDVITRIDDIDITSPDGGQRMGQVTPGSRVRFTFRRGSSSFVRELTAENRGVMAATPAPTMIRQRSGDPTIALRQATELLEQVRAQQSTERLQIERLAQATEQEREATVAQALRANREQARQLETLRLQLERAVAGLGAQTGGAQGGGGRMGTTPLLITTRENAIRYAGRLGEVDVEVRGSSGIVVNETAEEIIITTGESTIRLKKAALRR